MNSDLNDKSYTSAIDPVNKNYQLSKKQVDKGTSLQHFKKIRKMSKKNYRSVNRAFVPQRRKSEIKSNSRQDSGKMSK